MKQAPNKNRPSSPAKANATYPPVSETTTKSKRQRVAAGGAGGDGQTTTDETAATAPDTPRELGVRDPRPPARLVQPLADPRRAASRDLIDVQRRSLWRPRTNEPSPWLTTKERLDPSLASRTEGTFKELIAATNANADPIRTVVDFSANVVEQATENALTSDQAANMTTLPYRYTKGVETVNDELGYGERITESFCRISKDGTLETHERISQLTKSGRQQLRPFCEPDEHT